MATKKRKIEPVYVEFGQWFRRKRERLGLTQTEVAKQTRLSRGSICNIEGGKERVALHNIVRLCDLVGTRWRFP